MPQTVSNDGHLVFARLVFLFRKVTAANWFDTDGVQKICCHQETLDAFRGVSASKVGTPPPIQCELFERVILRAPIKIIGQRHFVVLHTTTWRLVPNGHQAVEIWKRQRLDQKRIDRAEDCSVRANTQRQSDNGYCREARPLYQISHRVTNITEKRFHDGSLSDALDLEFPSPFWERVYAVNPSPFNSLPKVGEKQSFHFNDHQCRIVVKLIAAKFAHRVDNDRLQLIGAAPLLLDE